MKTKAFINAMLRRNDTAELMEQLRNIAPDGRRSREPYGTQIYIHDPRYPRLMEFLERAGLRPWTEQSRTPDRHNEYELVLWREYEPSDLIECRLLEFVGFVRSKVKGSQPDGLYKLVSTGKDGVLDVNEGELDPKHAFLRSMDKYLCSGRTRGVLEGEKFNGLAFKPTRLRQRLNEGPEDEDYELGDVIPWNKWGQPWWEMIAERVMPPLSPSMRFAKFRLNEYHIVHPPLDDPNYVYAPYDGLYTPVELHYRQSDLEAAAQPDYAHTAEKFGPHQPIVVSRRFYDCCQAHGLESDWVPVRIDPD